MTFQRVRDDTGILHTFCMHFRANDNPMHQNHERIVLAIHVDVLAV
jgi:hypothetical protein